MSQPDSSTLPSTAPSPQIALSSPSIQRLHNLGTSLARDGINTPRSGASSTNTPLASTNSSRESLVPQKPGQLDFAALHQLFLKNTAPTANLSPLWYILTTAVLLSFHKEKLLGGLWTYLLSQTDSDEELLSMARRIREACLKSSTLVGFPRAINALFSLKSAIDASTPHLSSTLASDSSLRSPLSSSQKYARGLSFFRDIYQQHTNRVISAMDATSGGDLTHFAINCIYGELLAEHRIIAGLDTGLLEFVCCLADGCGPQAKGHFFGSVNLGADRETLRSAILLTQDVAGQLALPCPWTEDPDEFKFLDKVMLSA